MKKDDEQEHGCENCYYKYFDRRTYPCSMCLYGDERADMFQPEGWQKTGKWELSEYQNKDDNANGNYAFECTRCGHRDIHARGTVVPYCWWCGAKMDGGAE